MRRGRPPKSENGHAARPFSEMTLAERGWSKRQSIEIQRLAKIPDDAFEAILAALKRERRPLTRIGILRRYFNDCGNRARPASCERMAEILRAEGWTVIPPSKA